MKRTATILIALMPCLVFSEQKANDRSASPFTRIEMTNHVITAHLADSGIRWLLKNGTNQAVTTYGQAIQLEDGDEIELHEKHAHFTFRAVITNGLGHLHYICVFDARSFGKDIMTTNGTIEIKETR